MNVLLLVSDALGAILFLFCAVLSIRLLLMYEGGGLFERPWLPIFLGVIFLALSQPLTAIAPLLSSTWLGFVLLLRSLFVVFSALSIFAGLLRALRIWRKVSR
jgi:hypothetical protein